MKGSWGEFWRYWKLWLLFTILFTILFYVPWLVANWVLPFYGISEFWRSLTLIGGMILAFSVSLGAYYYGVGVPKCQFCGRPLERREKGSVVSYHCPVHGNVRGTIKEGS